MKDQIRKLNIFKELLGNSQFVLLSIFSIVCLGISIFHVIKIQDELEIYIENQKKLQTFSRHIQELPGYLHQTKTPIQNVLVNNSVSTEKIHLELAGSATQRHLDNIISEPILEINSFSKEFKKSLEQFKADYILLVQSGMDVMMNLSNNNKPRAVEKELIFNNNYSIIEKNYLNLENDFVLLNEKNSNENIDFFHKHTILFLVSALGIFFFLTLSIILGVKISKKQKQTNEVLQLNIQSALEKSNKIDVLLNTAPVGIYQTNELGECLSVNKKWLEISGLTESQAMGNGWYLGIHPEDRDRLSSEWKDFTDGKKPFHTKYRFQSPNGNITWVQGSAIPLHSNNSNTITGYIGTILDITAEKELDQALLFYKHAIDQSVIVTVADSKGNFTFVNEAFTDISQYSPDEVIGKNHRILNSGLHPKEFFVDMWKTISKGFVWKGQIRNKKKDGSFYWVDTVITPFRGSSGKIEFYYAIRKDVTSFKTMEENLAFRQSYLTAILNNSNYSIIATDNNGIIKTFNPAAERISGYSAHEMIDKESPAKFHDPNEVIKHAQKLEAELKKPVPVGFETLVTKANLGIVDENEWTYITKNGNKVPVLLSVTSIKNDKNEITGYLGVAVDLSEQKQKDTQFLNLVQNLPAAVYRTEINNFSSFEFVSDALETITGYRSSEFIKNNIRSFSSTIHPEDLEYVRLSIISAVENDLPYLIEYRVIDKKGQLRWVYERGQSYLIPGSFTDKYLDGAIFDITHLKTTEFELKSQKTFIEKITTAVPSFIYVISIETGNILYSNKNVFQYFGYNDEAKINIFDFLNENIHPEDQNLIINRRPVWSNSKSDFLDGKEFRLKQKNGHYVWLRDKNMVFRRNELGNPIEIICILEDVTNSKKLQKDLEEEKLKAVHSSKMASLGEMAGGISHEINNPLSIIEGNASKILRTVEKESFDIEDLKKAASKIEQTTERIAKIIKGLRSFSRDGAKDPFVPTTVKSLIDDTLSFCEARLANHRIELKINPFDPELKIDCRGVQLSQVILNLINNSSDAIHNMVNPWIQLNVIELNDNNIEISITDCGKGISPDVAEKIMQPFFTTKGIGKGTGLGLSIAKGIIESHQGRFYLDINCPNTRFVIELPKTHHLQLKKVS